jgi:ribosomal protein L7/L12
MLNDQVKAKVKDFIATGQKIEAIKYLRDNYPLSLADAKAWIDYLSGESSVEPGALSHTKSPLTAVAHEKVKSLVRVGKQLQAIKYLIDQYQLSLVQAKELVDAASNESGVKPTVTFRNPGMLGFYIFAGIGTLFLLIAAYFYWQDYTITHDSIIVTGKVIELRYGSSDLKSGAIPVVSYQWKGQPKLYYGSIYSNPPAVEVGEKVDLIVSRNNPDLVTLKIFSERYLFMIVFGFLGLIFALIGYLGLFMR